MLKIKQVADGKIIYEAEIENYNYSVPQFINNGATKVVVEYPTSTVVVEPVGEKDE